MYRAPTKRTELLRRIAVYSAMTVTVATLVTILVFVMLGYQFNRADGRIEQGGLVQFNTTPEGADVTIDGVNLGARTPSKATLTSGQHFVTMKRNGYKEWQKSIDVTAGAVQWQTYARLIPNSLKLTNIASFVTVSGALVSPDDKWMVIQENASTPTIRITDLSRDEVSVKTLELPVDSYTAPADDVIDADTFQLTSWDQDSRYVLVKHTYDSDMVEWLLVDTRDITQTKNVTKLLGFNATKLVFSNNNSMMLYALVDNNIRLVDVRAATLSRPLVENVAEFTLFKDATLTYVTNVSPDTKERSVGYYTFGTDKARTIRSYSDAGVTNLHIAIGTYFGDQYVAIAYGEHVDILTGSLPRSDSDAAVSLKAVATVSLPTSADYLSIKTNGRFVVAQHANAYSVYDLELSKVTTTALKGSGVQAKEIDWIDGYTAVGDLEGSLRLYEFDGANQQVIMPIASGLQPAISPNGKYLYAVARNIDGSFSLNRVLMILP